MKYNLPESEFCSVVNPVLWEIFVGEFKEKMNCPPNASMWTEENVAKWFDRNMTNKEDRIAYSD